MKLTSLELKGFKSFANQTVIHFNDDVIGIVGPNGSGKSNIVDAIRWVLGEQKSKQLRLEKMSNVIFNGTKKRKKAGVASVTLTFENTKNLLPTEYQTVSITRMLYQDGESEYRLNNVPCRLKDITSLFLDTGIGSNSYAIIALGMVDDILADKDNARRKMFEQAAGISKYKKRKHQTLNKLKNTAEDLDRIEDLLFEIDNNLKQLEKQARRAKRFYELKEKYKDLSIELSTVKLSKYKERNQEITSKLQEEEDRYRQIEVESRQMEAKLETEKKGNLDIEKTLSEQQRTVNEMIALIRNKESDKRVLIQKKTFIEENKIRLAEEIEMAKGRIQSLLQSIEEYRSKLNEEKSLESQLEHGLDGAESNLLAIRQNHGSLKAELDQYIEQQQLLDKEIFELEKNKAINNNQIENLRIDLARGENEIESRKVEIDDLQLQLEDVARKEKGRAEEVLALENEEARRQENIIIAEGELEKLRKSIADVNRKLDAKRNEYKLTKDLVENLEGFPESIKFLSKSKEWKQNVPLLSDLIYTKEEYRIAIENYLEPYLNYYVVENLEEAYQAIKLLGKTQKGKANFFILDAFSDYNAPISLLPNTLRAIDLIETEQKYYKLCSYLLQNVLVTESEDFSRNSGLKDLVLLSKSGRFVQRRFSVSGGSVGLFEGKKIGRKKNLEVLQQVIKQLESQETNLSSSFYGVKNQLEKLKSQISSEAINRKRDLLNQLTQEKVGLLTRLENFQSFLQDANAKNTQATEMINRLQKENEDIDRQLADKKNISEDAKSKISQTDGSFRELAEQLAIASNAFNEKKIEFVRQQNKVSTFQQELSFRENQLNETQSKLNADNQTVDQSDDEQKQIQLDIEQLESELLEDYKSKESQESNLNDAEQKYFSARGGINEIEDRLRAMNKRRQDAAMLIQSLKDKYNEMRLELTSIGERLRIEFGISVDDVLARELNEELNVEETEIKVEKLKKRLDNYGEINPMAMEAFDEMKERYDQISGQRDDILAAKASLLDTIKEIEDTATEQFLAAFEQVKTHFQDVFRTLFSEDDECNLFLDDPDNPLESTINITAKPKGKRPLTINQLSGGEKTLTATALLFALYLLKPAPFCIFDEVDAPLDDANIEKFNKIVRKFSETSQFIIVTHNKQTMAAVDVIYGVYMQEQGVSNLSPVDFRALEDTSSLVETAVG